MIQQQQNDLTFYQNTTEELKSRQQTYIRTQTDKEAEIDKPETTTLAERWEDIRP